MEKNVINISTFTRDHNFYDQIDLILTIKSFDLQAIRKRYIASRKSKTGKTGSVERREPSIGGIVSLSLTKGTIREEAILCKVAEPRGIDFRDELLAIAAENIIYVIEKNGKINTVSDPWFSYIHTVKFHPNDNSKILISSSGFDLIQEYDFKTHTKLFEWIAWENGFDTAKDPETNDNIILTRNRKRARELQEKSIKHLFINDPLADHLPTAKRAAFINSVTYDPKDPDYFLATFFHSGEVIRISRNDGASQTKLTGLKNPHGGQFHDGQIIATSTGTGEIFVKDDTNFDKLSFDDLPGKPSELDGLEWVQNTLCFGNYLIAIDSNRTSFVIIDRKKKRYDIIPFNNDWAVQDIISGKLNPNQVNAIGSIA